MSQPSEAGVRVETADRRQVQLLAMDLEALLPPEHSARQIWAYVERIDLSALYEGILSQEGKAGRAATDPKVLLALWLYGIADGVGSARELTRLTECHDAYKWLRGGVGLNYHTVSDFRTQHPTAIDGLLTDMLGTLVHAGLVTLHRVAQDGTKVRANAGASSFHRKESLYKAMKRARQQLRAVDEQAKDSTLNARQQAAQERAAQERMERVEKALSELPLVRSKQAERKREQKGKKPNPPRASTTDVDARVMKMGDGGYRPAFNVQLATDSGTGIITGVNVVNTPADNHQLIPMLDDIENRTGELPDEMLNDAGYIHYESITEAGERDVKLFMALKMKEEMGADGKPLGPYEPRPNDPPEVAALRKRMRSKAGKEIYKERSAVAERPNAQLKTEMGLTRFLVRGLPKVTSVTVLTVLAFNLQRLISLGLT